MKNLYLSRIDYINIIQSLVESEAELRGREISELVKKIQTKAGHFNLVHGGN
jgi:hypothetical protein